MGLFFFHQDVQSLKVFSIRDKVLNHGMIHYFFCLARQEERLLSKTAMEKANGLKKKKYSGRNGSFSQRD